MRGRENVPSVEVQCRVVAEVRMLSRFEARQSPGRCERRCSRGDGVGDHDHRVPGGDRPVRLAAQLQPGDGVHTAGGEQLAEGRGAWGHVAHLGSTSARTFSSHPNPRPRTHVKFRRRRPWRVTNLRNGGG